MRKKTRADRLTEDVDENVRQVFDLQDTTSDPAPLSLRVPEYTDSRRAPLSVETPEFDYLDRPSGWKPRQASLEELDRTVSWLVAAVCVLALAVLGIGAVLFAMGT